jgi:hypothetical protein
LENCRQQRYMNRRNGCGCSNNSSTNSMVSRQVNRPEGSYCSVNYIDNMPVAMAYVPWQHFTEVYETCKAFQIGTIFPELDLPFCRTRCGRV